MKTPVRVEAIGWTGRSASWGRLRAVGYLQHHSRCHNGSTCLYFYTPSLRQRLFPWREGGLAPRAISSSWEHPVAVGSQPSAEGSRHPVPWAS